MGPTPRLRSGCPAGAPFRSCGIVESSRAYQLMHQDQAEARKAEIKAKKQRMCNGSDAASGEADSSQ